MHQHIRSFRPRFVQSATAILPATLLLVAILFAPVLGLRAQLQKDTTHWNDEELYTEDATPQTYFAVGGGVLGGIFLANLSDFNTNIAQPFVRQNVPSSVFMLGGQGFIALPWVKGLRVGGMGYSGSSQQCCVDTQINGSAKSRTIQYSVGYGALTIDYVLPFHMKHFSIVPGIALGFGSVQIYAQQAANRASPFNISDEFAGGSDDYTHTYHSSFFLYMPQIQFEYTFKGFSMVRLSVGYQGTSMGTWSVDQNVNLGGNGSLANVNGSGLVANLGVFFGLFP
jgi:hypothetical protein